MQKQQQPTNNPYLDMACKDAQGYQRKHHLPALLALWPAELDDFSKKGTTRIINNLKTALQAERRRGRAGHWCYDLNRHLALVSALKGEMNNLADSGEKRRPALSKPRPIRS